MGAIQANGPVRRLSSLERRWMEGKAADNKDNNNNNNNDEARLRAMVVDRMFTSQFTVMFPLLIFLVPRRPIIRRRRLKAPPPIRSGPHLRRLDLLARLSRLFALMPVLSS
ncbi:hypothetical protein BJX66DRAFT_320248 [Aspergillus keveii]|uniref:Uncharacterized protein n=1 Tax=Aspergillus keveii TaxID=714993 RepID=A0ABR4FHP0_9EURO